MPQTTDGELGDRRTSSYTNATSTDTDTVVRFPDIQKPGQRGPKASLSFADHPELKELDTDGDGKIDEDDLIRLLNLKHREEHVIREQRYGLFFLSVIILAVGKPPTHTTLPPFRLFFSPPQSHSEVG